MTIDNKKIRPNDVAKSAIISFSNDDYPEGFNQDHNDPMVISATFHNYVIKRILVHQGSLTDILYSVEIASMNISKVDVKPHNGNLINFFSKQVPLKGKIRLRVTLGMQLTVVDMDIDFFIVEAPNNAYNAILDRTF